jgi:hypothetical protein
MLECYAINYAPNSFMQNTFEIMVNATLVFVLKCMLMLEWPYSVISRWSFYHGCLLNIFEMILLGFQQHLWLWYRFHFHISHA